MCHPVDSNQAAFMCRGSLFFPHQEKLAKSIHYLISKEDQVRTQITGLEQLISRTEVRQLTQAVREPNHSSNNAPPGSENSSLTIFSPGMFLKYLLNSYNSDLFCK